MIFPQKATLHLWFTRLNDDSHQTSYLQLLDPEERTRANRFKFALHRQRFIIAHTGLRSILSLYLNISPSSIQIHKTPEGKPYLEQSELQFNLSHSHDLAVYAFTTHTPVGIDIEKIRDTYNEGVAQRFFSVNEYEAFSKQPNEQKQVEFFRIWTSKEALIKALGKGLRFPLTSFSIPPRETNQEIHLKNQLPPQTWHLKTIDFFPGYALACVSAQPLTEVSYFEWPNPEQNA